MATDSDRRSFLPPLLIHVGLVCFLAGPVVQQLGIFHPTWHRWQAADPPGGLGWVEGMVVVLTHWILVVSVGVYLSSRARVTGACGRWRRAQVLGIVSVLTVTLIVIASPLHQHEHWYGLVWVGLTVPLLGTRLTAFASSPFWELAQEGSLPLRLVPHLLPRLLPGILAILLLLNDTPTYVWTSSVAAAVVALTGLDNRSTGRRWVAQAIAVDCATLIIALNADRHITLARHAVETLHEGVFSGSASAAALFHLIEKGDFDVFLTTSGVVAVAGLAIATVCAAVQPVVRAPADMHNDLP